MTNQGRVRVSIAALVILVAGALLLEAQDVRSGPWVMQSSGTTAGLRGIHAVGGGVAWASGTDGTVLRTEDSGYMWQSCAMPPGAEKLDFRGIWAWDANTAVAMSSGPGDLSRIYKTTDGCSHWTLLFTNPDKDGFWDAMVFQNQEKGSLLGDPVGGRFVFLSTDDAGKTWKRSGAAGLEAGDGVMGAFAASNSSLLAGSREPVLFGTGGADIYAQSHTGTVDFSSKPGTPVKMSERWTRTSTPLNAQGDAAGIFSLGFHEGSIPGYGYTVVAVGGDYAKPNESAGTAAWAIDGVHWTIAEKPPHGYRSAVAWDADAKAWIAVGTNGSDVSYDDGKTWIPVDSGNWNALSLPWVVGPKGRIAKLDPDKLPKK
ncbi:MAG: hypothetical protein WA400_10710 [Silvibacterium sp.]